MAGDLVVAASGFFDPPHLAHILYLRDARLLGTKLIVILSRNDQCRRKKGYCVLDYADRKAILENLRFVDLVVPNIDSGLSVAESLRHYHRLYGIKIFAKGGDRTPENMPPSEIETCRELGIKIVYGVGGGKIRSSSLIVSKLMREINEAGDA